MDINQLSEIVKKKISDKTNVESVKVKLDDEVIKQINEIQKKYPNPCP